jgi:uncharacterized protein YegP (UPF0339 family)
MKRNLWWEFYIDRRGEWRWRCTTRNGVVVGASTEGYKRRGRCIENAELFGAPADSLRAALGDQNVTRPRRVAKGSRLTAIRVRSRAR